MGCGTSQVVVSILIGVAVSCGNEVRDEEERPATFGDVCMLGALDRCHDPFVCLALPDFSADTTAMSICTVACQQTEDCPTWQASEGPCSGVVQSQCIRQICRDACR